MRALVLALWFFASIAIAPVVAPPAADSVTGTASWYGEEYRGRTMADGQSFNPEAMTAAAWDWPLGTRLVVTHGQRIVVVVVTDRGPAQRLRRQGRVIDLSRAAFERLAPLPQGLIAVSIAPE